MRRQIERSLCAIMMTVTLSMPTRAAELAVKMQKVTPEGTGETLGTITINGSAAGVVFKLALHGLPPGPHGFHAHVNANCGPTALNAWPFPAAPPAVTWTQDTPRSMKGRRAKATLATCRHWTWSRMDRPCRP